jgi:hypothetical protein
MLGTYRLKVGKGKHYVIGRGAPLLPGDEITCDPDDIEAFKDKFEVVVDPGPKPQPTEGLRVEHRGGGWFDVVNSLTGKTINSAPMRKVDAEQVVNASADDKLGVPFVSAVMGGTEEP